MSFSDFVCGLVHLFDESRPTPICARFLVAVDLPERAVTAREVQSRGVLRILQLQKRIRPPWWRRNQREFQFQLSCVQDQQLFAQEEDDFCFSLREARQRLTAKATDGT